MSPSLLDKINKYQPSGSIGIPEESLEQKLDRLAAEQGEKKYVPSTPSHPLAKIGQPIQEFLEGVGSDVARTATGIYNLGRNIPSLPGIPSLQGMPEPPEVLQQAASTRKIGPSGEDLGEREGAFKVGRGASEIASFFVPGGLVTKGVRAVRGLGKIPQIAARTLGEAASAGSITLAKSGGDTEAAAQAALTAGVTSGAFATIGGALKAIPPHLAFPGLKFPKKFSQDEVDNILKEALDHGFNISRGGVKKAGKFVKKAGAEKLAGVAQDAATPIDTTFLESTLNGLRTIGKNAGDKGFQKKVDKVWKEFLEEKGARPAGTMQIPGPKPEATLTPAGQPITVSTPAVPLRITQADAEKAKNALYDLTQEAYGKFRSNKAEVQKQIARGIKEGMEDLNPELFNLNQDIRNAATFQTAVSDFLRSHPNILSKDEMIMHAFLGATTGYNPSLFKITVPAALLMELYANPRIRSALAIMSTRTFGPAATTASRTVGRVAASQVPQTLPPMPHGPLGPSGPGAQ